MGAIVGGYLASIFHDLDTDCRQVDFAVIVLVVGV
jgi:hypothetical protein